MEGHRITAHTPTEIFELQVAAFARGDLDSMLAYFAEDSVFTDMTDHRPRRGRAAVREYMSDYLRAMTDVETEITTLLGTAEYAIAELVISGVWNGDGPGRGARVSLNYCVIDRVSDGMIQSEIAYWDSGQLAQQLQAHAAGQD